MYASVLQFGLILIITVVFYSSSVIGSSVLEVFCFCGTETSGDSALSERKVCCICIFDFSASGRPAGRREGKGSRCPNRRDGCTSIFNHIGLKMKIVSPDEHEHDRRLVVL